MSVVLNQNMQDVEHLWGQVQRAAVTEQPPLRDVEAKNAELVGLVVTLHRASERQ